MGKTSPLCIVCHAAPGRPHDVLPGYVCPGCERQKSYRTTNAVLLGASCTLPSFSLEFEIGARPLARRRALILLHYQFERTADSTVDDEYKSPMYQNLRAFRKPLSVLHTLRDLVDERCGTHLHVTFRHQWELQQVRQAIFEPLIAHLAAHEAQTLAFWGRTFCTHAAASLCSYERHASFNTYSRHPTIEYRLPRFRCAEQYLAVVRFCRDTTVLLDRFFDAQQGLEPVARLSTPAQIGARILARYQQAMVAFETGGLAPPQRERISLCAD